MAMGPEASSPQPEEAFSMRRLVLPAAIALLTAACSAGTPLATEPPVSQPPATQAPATEAPATTSTTQPAEVDDGFPVIVTTVLGEVEIPTRPERIVSLSASATETLFAIGAGPQVVAADSFSYFPEEAPALDDLLAFEPNVESIATEFDPDLVVLAFDPGTVVEAFAALGVPVLVQGAPTNFDEAYAQWEQLGAATGNLAEAVALVNQTQDAINEAVASVGDAAAEVTFYHELDPTMYSVTSSTFLGAVYDRFGMTNIADDADPDGWGYPQLSPEYLVDTSPEVIFFTGCCGDTVETISSRPGWETITAVANGDVFEVDQDMASRWGPRIGELAQAIAEALAAVIGANA